MKAKPTPRHQLPANCAALVSIQPHYLADIADGHKTVEVRPLWFEMPADGGVFFLVATGQRHHQRLCKDLIRVGRPTQRLPSDKLDEYDQEIIEDAAMTGADFSKYAANRTLFVYPIIQHIPVSICMEPRGVAGAALMMGDFACKRPPQSFAYVTFEELEQRAGFRMPGTPELPPADDTDTDDELTTMDVPFDGDDSGMQLKLI